MNYKLFANCIPVRGTSRSLICDLQRQKIHFIPNALCDILNTNEQVNFDSLVVGLTLEESAIIKEYKKFLVKNEYIFTDTNLRLFPKMSLDWDIPASIQNAIIQIEENNAYEFDNVIKQLEKLGTQAIELRILKFSTEKYLLDLIHCFKLTNITFVTMIVNNEIKVENIFWKNMVHKEKRIKDIFIYGDFEQNSSLYVDECDATINYLSKKEVLPIHCGKVDQRYFVANIFHFTEAVHYNTCLNRKVSIDINGEIKNCPSMLKSYGNINDTTIEEALKSNDFKHLWNINKDQIDVCKNCEFRYVCTDCRAYLEDPNNVYSKPLKCGYNPETCEWEEWSTNPLKHKAIEYYGMSDLIKKD